MVAGLPKSWIKDTIFHFLCFLRDGIFYGMEVVMKLLQQIRLELCQALDKCHGCSLFHQVNDGNRLLQHCKSQCRHWIEIQEKRNRMEMFQQQKRKKKLHFVDLKLGIDRDELHQMIGMKLVEYRESQQLTQKQVAEKIGVDHSTVSKHEKGQRKIPPKILQLYADLYNISWGDITNIFEGLEGGRV